MQKRVLDSALVVPSISMAAHVEDEEVEVELDRIEVNETAATGIEKGPANKIIGVPFSLPAPPPIRRNGYWLVCHFIIANSLKHYIILISYLDTPFTFMCFSN